jgi:hypothetical protein
MHGPVWQQPNHRPGAAAKEAGVAVDTEAIRVAVRAVLILLVLACAGCTAASTPSPQFAAPPTGGGNEGGGMGGGSGGM